MHGDMEALRVIQEFLQFEVRNIVTGFFVDAREKVLGCQLRLVMRCPWRCF